MVSFSLTFILEFASVGYSMFKNSGYTFTKTDVDFTLGSALVFMVMTCVEYVVREYITGAV